MILILIKLIYKLFVYFIYLLTYTIQHSTAINYKMGIKSEI